MAALTARPSGARRAEVGVAEEDREVRVAQQRAAMATRPRGARSGCRRASVGSDSTSAQSRATGTIEARIQGDGPAAEAASRASTPTRSAARRARRRRRRRAKPDPALARVPGQARSAHGLADDRGHPVARRASTPQTAAAIQSSSRKHEHEAEHRQRIEEDAERVAGAVLGLAPQRAAAQARQHLPVEEEGGGGHERGLRPGEIAQQEGEPAHARCGRSLRLSSPAVRGTVRPTGPRAASPRCARRPSRSGVGGSPARARAFALEYAQCSRKTPTTSWVSMRRQPGELRPRYSMRSPGPRPRA